MKITHAVLKALGAKEIGVKGNEYNRWKFDFDDFHFFVQKTPPSVVFDKKLRIPKPKPTWYFENQYGPPTSVRTVAELMEYAYRYGIVDGRSDLRRMIKGILEI